MREPVRDDAGLAGTGAGENEERALGMEYGLSLLRVEAD
jgi:hypothetical protein